MAPSPTKQAESSRWWWWWRNNAFICLPHDVFPPQEASPLWETCPGSPWGGQSRTWRSPQSPPGPPRAVAPCLPAPTCLLRSPPRQSGDLWWWWSPLQPPSWTWSWPSCWSTCARCPIGFPSCRPQCPAPALPQRLCTAGASCPQAPSGAGTETGSQIECNCRWTDDEDDMECEASIILKFKGGVFAGIQGWSKIKAIVLYM